MQHKINKLPKANCFLVEVIAKNSQNIPWIISLDSEQISDNRIRRLSIDKFYEIVTNDKNAFKNLLGLISFPKSNLLIIFRMIESRVLKIDVSSSAEK